MYTQTLLAALFAATAAGVPLAPKGRQLTGTDPSSLLSSLLGGLGGSIPTGTAVPSLPTGLLGGLGGGSCSGSGIPALPTGLLGGLGSSGSSEDGEDSLSGSSGNLDATSRSTGTKALQERQFGGTSTTSSGSVLSSLLSGLGGTSSTSSTSSGLGALTGGTDTENGLSNACQNVTVIFARGTTESGNVGSIVGPGLTTDVESALSNKVNVQGVDYAADAAGIAEEATGPGTGSEDMIADVQSALSKCPDTQIVLSGYSQGAMLVHNTMGALSTTQAAAVKACVTFGDPFVGEAITNFSSDNWKSFCATDDPVCEAGAASSPASGGTTSASTLSHLGYGSDTGTAATFIKSKVSV